MPTGNDGNSGSTRMVSLVDNVLHSKDLFLHGRELKIIHDSEEYKLRLTGNGKLILTK
ncbi:MAG: hemin transporter HemP [Sneathiella sp.]|nr:MAG: hemin transporter HemP [Sneathiella sp.]